MIASRATVRWLRAVGWAGAAGAVTFLLTRAADGLFGLPAPLTLPGTVGLALAGLAFAVGLVAAAAGVRCPRCRARVTALVLRSWTDPPADRCPYCRHPLPEAFGGRAGRPRPTGAAGEPGTADRAGANG